MDETSIVEERGRMIDQMELAITGFYTSCPMSARRLNLRRQ
jgi:hypothetical protein